MPPIDPRIVKAKRYPAHAAVTICYMAELKRLLTEDAPFHVVRKVPDLELSVLHSACASRLGSPQSIFAEILNYLIEMGAPINDRDAYGQTALHYAVCHQDALTLVTILINNGAQLDPDRMGDGWTPLHLAAMFNKLDVVLKLLEMGADPSVRAANGDTPEKVAKSYKNHRLADVLHSPREAFTPTSFPSQFMNIMRKHERQPPPMKFSDEHINWRDEDGNTILHYAAWTGNIYLARNLFDSAKGKTLIGIANNKGATAFALAIIATQDKMVEEFFMNKTAKKCIDFEATLHESKESIAHLLLQYAPFVHPKFLLKRKDLTKEILNKIDAEGNTPLLHVASRNNMHTVRHILTSKAVKDGHMLDLGIKNNQGRTLLHYLVENRDEENFRCLLDREELTADVANIPDKEGKTPMFYCLTKGSPYMARDILSHPTAKDKFRLDLCQVPDGRSPLHLVADQGNAELWSIATHLSPDCDFNVKDSEGNSPLMRAVIRQKLKILDAWLLDKGKIPCTKQDLVNNEGKTLVMLITEHLAPMRLRSFLSSVDIREHINLTNKDGNTALLMASIGNKWSMAKEMLTHPGLKIGDPGDPEEQEGTVDVHVQDCSGQTSLTIQMVARVKLARAEQTFNMKKQRVLAAEAKRELDLVWEVIKLVLVREKEMHGTSMSQGRDGGSECIRKQLSVAKLIRPQSIDELIQEYVKLYNVIKKKRPPKPEPASVTTSGPTTFDPKSVTLSAPAAPKSTSSSAPAASNSSSPAAAQPEYAKPSAVVEIDTSKTPAASTTPPVSAKPEKPEESAKPANVTPVELVASIESEASGKQTSVPSKPIQTTSGGIPAKSQPVDSKNPLEKPGSSKSTSNPEKPKSVSAERIPGHSTSKSDPEDEEWSPESPKMKQNQADEESSKDRISKTLVNGETKANGSRLIPGKLLIKEKDMIEDEEPSPPLAPRRTKRKTTDTSTQTDPFSGFCACCCTCKKQ